MPTNFDTEFSEAMQELLGASDDPSDLGEFAEYITYHPTHAGNTGPRAIRAMVDRGPPDTPGETPDVPTPMVVIEVENHHTRGIDSGLLDTGGDEVELELWPGQGRKRLQIKRRVPQSDNAILRLECR